MPNFFLTIFTHHYNVQTDNQKGEKHNMSQARAFRRIVVEVDPALDDRLRLYAQKYALTRKAVITAALEAFLSKHEDQEDIAP